jgi:hypothetical protein
MRTTTYLRIVDEMQGWEVELRMKDENDHLPADRGRDAGLRSWTADDKPRATNPLRMRTTTYLRIVDEMQSREVELRRLVLLFLLPVSLFNVLQILFPLPRLLVRSAVSTDHR